MPKRRIAAEIVDTPHDAAAVTYLKEVQKSLALSNRDFAKRVSEELGVPISENVFGYYLGVKSRRQPMPAAILVAAIRLSGIPFEDKEAARTLAEELRAIRGELERLRHQERARPTLIEDVLLGE